MTNKQIIDLTKIDQKYKDKCSLIKAGKCKNVNIFIEQSRNLKAKEQELNQLKQALQKIKELAEYDRDCEYECSIKQILQIINEVEEWK